MTSRGDPARPARHGVGGPGGAEAMRQAVRIILLTVAVYLALC